MTREKALEMVTQLIATLREEDVTQIDSSRGLLEYLDSLDLIGIVGDLEERLDIYIDSSDVERAYSVRGLAEVVVELVAKKEAGS